MKWKKEHLVLIAVIAVLAAYLVAHKSGSTHYTLPAVARIAPKDITKLVIKNGDSLITLAKKDARWVIEPQGYPADPGVVQNLLEDAGGLTLTALVSEGGDEAVYDLDPGRRIEVEASAADGPVRTIEVGKTASGAHTFVELGGQPGIFHAENDLRSAFDKTVSALRDKTVLKIDGGVTELALTKGGKTRLVEKAGAADRKGRPGQAWMIGGKKSANGAAADELVSILSNLTCDDFLDGKTKKDFHAPLYTVSLKGAKRYTLSLYRGKDGDYPALSSDSPYPFRLSSWTAKNIVKDVDALLSSRPSTLKGPA